MKRRGILLINLGTPDNCTPRSIKRYLKEFLNDPRVIDLPWLLRWPLVQLFILPFRYQKTTAAYHQIWQNGSPLLQHTRSLTEALTTVLSPNDQITFGMRYGHPSIEEALAKFKEIDELIVLPLFPQYASASTGSALEKLFCLLAAKWNIPAVRVINQFYANPHYIDASATIIREHLKTHAVDYILFSYHGLPERHLNKSHCHAVCDHLHTCPAINTANQYCYRAQCYTTTRLIAEKLLFTPDQYGVSFQSRLGRTPWIKPYTDLLLPELRKRGIKNIAMTSPSFVADCLETLEEINIRTRAQWLQLGGEEFIFIPCLNATPVWRDAVKNIINHL